MDYSHSCILVCFFFSVFFFSLSFLAVRDAIPRTYRTLLYRTTVHTIHTRKKTEQSLRIQVSVNCPAQGHPPLPRPPLPLKITLRHTFNDMIDTIYCIFSTHCKNGIMDSDVTTTGKVITLRSCLYQLRGNRDS